MALAPIETGAPPPNDQAQQPGPPAETTTLESRKGGAGRLQRVVRRGGPLRSTTAELIRVKRHKFPDAHRRPASHPLHAVRQPGLSTIRQGGWLDSGFQPQGNRLVVSQLPQLKPAVPLSARLPHQALKFNLYFYNLQIPPDLVVKT
jgi:hypothetical protein